MKSPRLWNDTMNRGRTRGSAARRPTRSTTASSPPTDAHASNRVHGGRVVRRAPSRGRWCAAAPVRRLHSNLACTVAANTYPSSDQIASTEWRNGSSVAAALPVRTGRVDTRNLGPNCQRTFAALCCHRERAVTSPITSRCCHHYKEKEAWVRATTVRKTTKRTRRPSRTARSR